MPVLTLVVGKLEANCHIVWREGERDALVMDPGSDANAIVDAIESRGLVPRVLFLTHGHMDHIAAAHALKERYPEIEVAALAAERETLGRATLNLSLFLGEKLKPPEPDRLLAEGDDVTVGSLRFVVMHLPGHTPGGGALVGEVDGTRVAFTGDVLFAGGVGRSDFPGGDEAALFASIRERLFALPDETRVLSGHGPETTIGREKRTNPFLR